MLAQQDKQAVAALNRLRGMPEWQAVKAFLQASRTQCLELLADEEDEGRIRKLQGEVSAVKEIIEAVEGSGEAMERFRRTDAAKSAPRA